MKKTFTLFSLLLLMVAFQSSFAQCTTPGTAYSVNNNQVFQINTATGLYIYDNANIYSYGNGTSNQFTWRFDLVVVTPNLPFGYKYQMNTRSRISPYNTAYAFTGTNDVISILRNGTNELLQFENNYGTISFWALPNDTLRFLYKGAGCNDNNRGTSFYGNEITISSPSLTVPNKPVTNTATGVTTTTSPVVFSWNKVPGSSTYCIRIFSDVNLTNLVTSVCGLNQTSYTWTPGGNIRAEQVQVDSFFYQIAGENLAGVGDWSDASRIDVETVVTSYDATNDYGMSTSIIPNPNQGNFTLVLKGADAADYKVLDNAGKIVASGILSKGENNLSAGLNPGIYYLVTPQKVQKMVVY